MKGMSMKCLLLLAGMAYYLMAAEPANLLTNGGFETNPNGAAYGWLFQTQTNDSVQAERVIDSTSGTAKEGTNFCRITVTGVSSQNWHVQMKDPTWAADSGHKYQFSMWARADSARTAQISVYGGPSSNDTYRTSSQQFSLTTEWQQFYMVFISDAKGAGKINFAFVCGFHTGVYDIDDVVILDKGLTNNMYPNGDFEVGGAGWSLYVNNDEGSTAAATMSFPSEGAREGSTFCRIQVTAVTEGNDWHVQLQDGSWTSKENTSYTISLLAKADNALTINIAAQAGKSRDYEYLGGSSVTLTQEWQPFTFTYSNDSVGPGPDSLNFFIYCGAAVGTYDFDSIVLLGTEGAGVVESPNGFSTTAQRQFSLQLRPEQIRCHTNEVIAAPFTVDIYTVQGRLFSSQSVTAAGRSFDLPRPPSGTWVVKVDANRSGAITIP
ncbi:MAG: carbohydrate binding domain-containing protein [Chitinispirillaceae bacterium]|nr:carbohydrate binding domain-containing protein [Chitinispirillaceae bacterium]